MIKFTYLVMLIAGIILLISGCDKQITSPENPQGTNTENKIGQLGNVDHSKGGGVREVQCCSGSIGGVVWNDLNMNGIQDPGEPGLTGVTINLRDANGNLIVTCGTNLDGTYGWGVCGGTYILEAIPPAGYVLSPANAPGSTPANHSNPDPYTVIVGCDANNSGTFGFYLPPPPPPTGTCARTLGYWKTHLKQWPVNSVTIGGVVYPKVLALVYLWLPSADKRLTMFKELVSAKLNVAGGSRSDCITGTISNADQWMSTYAGGGLWKGKSISGSSAAWITGEPLATQLDSYNNGLLCAPHCEECDHNP